MIRTVAAVLIAVLSAPAAFAGEPEYATKMEELNEKVSAADREASNAAKVADYATACTSSKLAAKLMQDYVELAYQYREALYAETNMTPEQLEIHSSEKVLPLILNVSRMKTTSAGLCAKITTTD